MLSIKPERILMLASMTGLLAVGLVGQASAQNIVVNPGFETGDFTGWNTTNAAFGSLFGVDGNPHSGNNAAFFGGVSSTPFDDDVISQVLPTVAGHNYSLDFFVSNNGGAPNDFRALVNGTAVFTLQDADAFGYMEETFTFLATGSDTLAFAARQRPAFYFLDDVSVTDLGAAVPEPGSIATFAGLGMAGAGFAFARLRRRRK